MSNKWVKSGVLALSILIDNVNALENNVYVSATLGQAKFKNISNSAIPLVKQVGVSMTEPNELGLQFKNAARFSGALGYQYDNTRCEVELSHLKSPYQKMTSGFGKYGFFDGHMKGSLQAQSAFVNAYYDFKNLNPNIYPFVGIGVGLTKIKNEIRIFHVDKVDIGVIQEKKLGQQLMAGINFVVNEKVSANLHYRYLTTGKLNALDKRLQANSFGLGLKVNF